MKAMGNKSCVPYAIITDLVKENEDKFPFINESVLRNGIARAKKKLANSPEPSTLDASTFIKSSNITNSTPTKTTALHALTTNVTTTNTTTTNAMTTNTEHFVEAAGDNQIGTKRKAVGFPKGTGKEKKRIDKFTFQNIMNICAQRLLDTHDPSTSGPFPPGLTEEVIKEVKVEMKMHTVKISGRALRKRVHQHKVTCFGRGIISPTRKLDATMIAIIKQLADMRQCITSTEAIGIMNSLIKGKETEKEIHEYKKSLGMAPVNKDRSTLGIRWWSAFLCRNEYPFLFLSPLSVNS